MEDRLGEGGLDRELEPEPRLLPGGEAAEIVVHGGPFRSRGLFGPPYQRAGPLTTDRVRGPKLVTGVTRPPKAKQEPDR
ncbi:hypothetical protein GCM10022274_23410 [Brevibacterium ammoniilyticum]